ncbi:MAG TPA: C40 family peptidase [Longimicrobiaceae bacterium]|nr:C40 family peptidase [Longimicrobiaceae bacterium]
MTRTAALLPALLLLPAALSAQARTSLSAFTSTGAGLTAARMGGTLATERDGLGLRLGAAVDAVPRAAGAPSRWMADVDGVGHLGRLLPGLDGVRLLVGVGAQQTATGGVALSSSLGGIYTHQVAGPLALEGEGRYRTPFADGMPARLEVRAGVALAFGPARRPVVARPTHPRASIHLAVPAGAPASASAMAALAIGTGESFLGVPYRWGGNTPEEGFDCSGFLRYVYRMHGVELPRVTRDQVRMGEPVPTRIEELRPGDLMFFAKDGSYIDHAAMYVGEGRILHSSASGKGVRYDDLFSRRGEYYRTHFVAARRVLTEEAAGRIGAPGGR